MCSTPESPRPRLEVSAVTLELRRQQYRVSVVDLKCRVATAAPPNGALSLDDVTDVVDVIGVIDVIDVTGVIDVIGVTDVIGVINVIDDVFLFRA
jgi:hypothetical protein